MFKVKDRMTTPIVIVKVDKEEVEGRIIKTETEIEQTWAVWKSYGGTQTTAGSQTNGRTGTSFAVYEDTATVQLRYTPNLRQGDKIKNLLTNEMYSVITVPDDINQMHLYLVVKVKRVV